MALYNKVGHEIRIIIQIKNIQINLAKLMTVYYYEFHCPVNRGILSVPPCSSLVWMKVHELKSKLNLDNMPTKPVLYFDA